MWKSIAAACVLLASSIIGASAQTYPDRSIRVVVPYPAGGPTDTIARAVTQSVAGALGQSVVIENQAGAGGRIALKQVANAAPDGYTLLMGGTNNNAVTPAVYKDLDFDAVNDFAPVASISVRTLLTKLPTPVALMLARSIMSPAEKLWMVAPGMLPVIFNT